MVATNKSYEQWMQEFCSVRRAMQFLAANNDFFEAKDTCSGTDFEFVLSSHVGCVHYR
jgi:hypothetical protein